MRKLLELLFSQEVRDTEITLYCSGCQFTGKLLPSADEEIITLSAGERWFTLEAAAVIGFSRSEAPCRTVDRSSEREDQQKEEILSIAQEIQIGKEEPADVLKCIQAAVLKRVRNYPDIFAEVEEILREMGDTPQQEASGVLLERVEALQARKPGCVTALKILSAGIHYIGGNQEKAAGILWEAGQFKIALPVIQTVWGEPYYLDCLGYAISDPDPQTLEENRELLFHYTRLCRELGDVSLLTNIAQSIQSISSEDGGGFFSPLLWGALFYLVQEKNEVEVSPVPVLLRKIKQYYPNNGMLLRRQNELPEKLRQLFSNAPSRVAPVPGRDVVKRVSQPAFQEARREMPRPQYYIGAISGRNQQENGNFQFWIKIGDTKEIYLNDKQIADPLLLHKLCSGTEQACVGTKVCFRLGSNQNGICAADAVMTRQERLVYQRRLAAEGGMPLRYKYLPSNYSEEERLALGREALGRAAAEAGKEQLDDVEFLIFLNNYLSNPQMWEKIGYPAAIAGQEEMEEHFKMDCWGDEADQTKWADSLDRLLYRSGKREWAELFRSMREGLESSHPMYIPPKLRADPDTISPEALLSEYIFPESAQGRYEEAMDYIHLWKEKTTNLRKNKGTLWERVCKLEEVCQAALAGDEEALQQRTAELFEKLTEMQRKKLAPLFAAGKAEGGAK